MKGRGEGKERNEEGNGKQTKPENAERCGEWRAREGEGSEAGAGGRGDKGSAVFPDVAAVCWLFAAPAPRITAFTLQLKNSPRDNLFSWSTPSNIVCAQNSLLFCPV